LVIKGPKLVA